MNNYTKYLVYCVTKEFDEYGMATCGHYAIVNVRYSENETRIMKERKAVEAWKFQQGCSHLDIELERVIYDVPVWSAVDVSDEGQDNDSYYIVVQHLPYKISK